MGKTLHAPAARCVLGAPLRCGADLQKVMTDPEVKGRLDKEGADPAHTTPAEFRSFIRSEVAKWNKVIKAANLAAPDAPR